MAGLSRTISFKPLGIATDLVGNFYITDRLSSSIYKVNQTGHVVRIAGNGASGFSGDGGPATSASLAYTTDLGSKSIALDALGNIFIPDEGNNRIRRIDNVTGIITTIAGNGFYNFSGEGGVATHASFGVSGVAVDSLGNIFIVFPACSRILRVDHVTSIITTIAGRGCTHGPVFNGGFSGDDGPATRADLHFPSALTIAASGDLVLVDTGNNRIRRVDHATGIITTVAGTGAGGGLGDGGPATRAMLNNPHGVALDASGNIFIADTGNNRIRRVDHATSVITTVAGIGGGAYGGFSGDGGPATRAQLKSPCCVALAHSGDLFIADSGNNRVRQVDHTTGIISTIAGNGAEVSAANLSLSHGE